MTDWVDDSELRALGADLVRAGSGIAARVRPVVLRGAGNISRQMRREMSASEYFKPAAGTIGFDLRTFEGFGVGVIEAEIGPSAEAGSPGNIANVAYFGGANGGGGTVPDPQGALDEEMPRYIAALEDVLGDLL